MELLYVWIEEYNNIHHKGFNFSPKHHFEFKPTAYDENKKVTGGTLTHDDINPDYPENFFGEHISNITAIVGKNGSGKSSLVKVILDNNCIPRLRYLLIYREYEHIRYNSSINIIHSNIELHGSNSNIKSFSTVYYSPFINSNLNFIDNQSIINISSIFNLGIAVEARKTNKSKGSITYSPYSNGLGVSIFHMEEMTTQIQFVSYFTNNKTRLIPFEVPSELDLVLPIIKTIDSEGFLTTHLITELLIDLFKTNINLNNYETDTNNKHIEINNIQTLNDICNINPTYDIRQINIFIDSLKGKCYNVKEVLNDKILIIKLKLEDIKKTGIIPNISNYGIGVFSDMKIWVDDLGISLRWREMSDGEITLLTIMSRIWKTQMQYWYSKIFILDEFDLGFHPQWQKEAISKIISFFNSLEVKWHHLILTTHSPILVSDLPSENIVFLDKDADGNSVVKEPKDLVRTFGANIHNLYRSSFFMQDGLMGEFAKDKIDGVITDLKSKRKINAKRKAEIRYIIDMVGEDILRYGLEKMYISKFKLSKREELELKRAEINRQLQELEKHDSNKN